jgi:hypothetical protein
MPTRTRLPPNSGQEQAAPKSTVAGGSPNERRATEVSGRIFERIRETLDSLARQMSARRRNLGRLSRSTEFPS